MTETMQWLSTLLAAGPVRSIDVKARADAAGIGTKSLRNARSALGVLIVRSGSGTAMQSVWALDGTNRVAGPAETGCGRRPVSVERPDDAPAQPPAESTSLDTFERARVERRVEFFMRRGMEPADAEQLAVALTLHRDRERPHDGSCAECQLFERRQCAVVRPLTEIHWCASARRDAP